MIKRSIQAEDITLVKITFSKIPRNKLNQGGERSIC